MFEICNGLAVGPLDAANMFGLVVSNMTSRLMYLKGVVGVVENELDLLRDRFKVLDKQMGDFSRTSTRIGERLKVGYFSNCASVAGNSLKRLSPAHEHKLDNILLSRP